jgi:hypothetical protein
VKADDGTRDDQAQSGRLGTRWSSPAVVAIFTAALGLFGNLIVALINDFNAQELAERTAQTNIILQGTDTNGDLQRACNNLDFFVSVGVLLDPKGQIVDGICNKPVGGIPLVGTLSVASKAVDQIPKLPEIPGCTGSETGIAPSTTSVEGGNVPGPPITATMVTLQKVDAGDNYIFHVSFVVPNAPSYTFNTVKIYGMQIVGNQRSNEVDYPSKTGNWRPGDHISFSQEVSKTRTDPSQGWDLTFCVGSPVSCYPSPNLLRLAP